jgi:hypothetical protein
VIQVHSPSTSRCLASQLYVAVSPTFSPSYWLHQLKPHPFIALRFLPQAEYEAAAPLSVSPTPDITIRVLVLFKGLNAQAAGIWDMVGPTFATPSSIWKGIVNPGTNLTDESYPFSVTELGGMEVP